MTLSPARAALAVLLALGPSGPIAAAEIDPAPPGLRGGRVLDMPGLPPIQLPPGARVFGPNGPGVDDRPDRPAPRSARPDAAGRRADKPGAEPRRVEPKRVDRIAPHSVPSREESRAKVLDALYARLKAADDEEDAKGVAGAIERVWMRSGSDTADLLMTRAVAAVAGHDIKTAQSLLDSIVEIEPDWAEGWNKRAMLRFAADNIDGAMTDIEHALKLDPRHFVALAGAGAILAKAGLDKRALDAYRRALDIYPQQPEVKKSVEKLQIEVEGRDI